MVPFRPSARTVVTASTDGAESCGRLLDLADDELGEAFANELLAAGADKVFSISGATGAGIEELLDGVLSYLPDRTATETKAAEVEDAEEGGADEWSPI